MERQQGRAGHAGGNEGAGQQDSTNDGWLSEMASAFLSSTGATDLLAGGEDVPLPTHDVQTQLNSLPDPAAALQVCGDLLIVVTSHCTRAQLPTGPQRLLLT